MQGTSSAELLGGISVGAGGTATRRRPHAIAPSGAERLGPVLRTLRSPRRLIRLGHAGLQAHLVDRFDRVPTQVVERCHGLHPGRLQQLLADLGESLRHLLVASQPRQLLQPRATAAIAPKPASNHPDSEPRNPRVLCYSSLGLKFLRWSSNCLLAKKRKYFDCRLTTFPRNISSSGSDSRNGSFAARAVRRSAAA